MRAVRSAKIKNSAYTLRGRLDKDRVSVCAAICFSSSFGSGRIFKAVFAIVRKNQYTRARPKTIDDVTGFLTRTTHRALSRPAYTPQHDRRALLWSVSAARPPIGPPKHVRRCRFVSNLVRSGQRTYYVSFLVFQNYRHLHQRHRVRVTNITYNRARLLA